MKKNTTKKSTAPVKAKKPVVLQTGSDVRSAVLIVSLMLNLFVFCIWLTLQITSQYDQALYNVFVLR